MSLAAPLPAPAARFPALLPFLHAAAGASLLFSAAIFGFFYAWVCSTMWGLDAIPPKIAIEAMNGMNASVRNIVFAPAFFGTPVVLVLTAGLAHLAGRPGVAALFAAAAVIYIGGAFLVTITVNVPMNQALMAGEISANEAEAQAVWTAYSQKWQLFNLVRTCVSCVVLALVGLALFRLGRG